MVVLNLMSTVLEDTKPAPVTVTDVPPLPVATESVILGMTVKVAVADPPVLSRAFTVRAPGATAVTLNDAVNPPYTVLVMEAGVVATTTFSKVIVMGFEARNPEPMI
jgi:hypothetical protein